MKRAIIGSLLGIAASTMTVAPCYGQGFVIFANYAYNTYGPVTYAASNVPDGKAGLAVGPGFSASLYYGFGTISDPNALTLLADQPGYPTTFSGNADGDTANMAGLFLGPIVAIPGYGYTASPITFEVVAW